MWEVGEKVGDEGESLENKGNEENWNMWDVGFVGSIYWIPRNCSGTSLLLRIGYSFGLMWFWNFWFKLKEI